MVFLVSLELQIQNLKVLRGHRCAFFNPASFSTLMKLIFTGLSPSSYFIVLSISGRLSSLNFPVTFSSIISSEKSWCGSDIPPGISIAPERTLSWNLSPCSASVCHQSASLVNCVMLRATVVSSSIFLPLGMACRRRLLNAQTYRCHAIIIPLPSKAPSFLMQSYRSLFSFIS